MVAVAVRALLLVNATVAVMTHGPDAVGPVATTSDPPPAAAGTAEQSKDKARHHANALWDMAAYKSVCIPVKQQQCMVCVCIVC
jgi:hypothetical protein